MKKYYIAHRGNFEGKNPLMENSPSYIDIALKNNFDVEIDLRMKNKRFYLGHDIEQYLIDIEWIEKRKNNLWIHTKNFEAFSWILENKKNWTCFWHQEDNYALTSNNYIWTYPGYNLSHRSIAVMPELTNYDIKKIYNCAGICSDDIKYIMGNLKHESI